MPEAAISGRQFVAQVSAEPSAKNVKRIGDELSALPATSPMGEGGVALPVIDESASARRPDASVLDNERDICTPCHLGIGAVL